MQFKLRLYQSTYVLSSITSMLAIKNHRFNHLRFTDGSLTRSVPVSKYFGSLVYDLVGPIALRGRALE